MNGTARRHVLIAGGALLAPRWGLASSKQRIVITGASTLAPLISDAAKRFEELNPGIQIDVQTGGTSRGIKDARTGIAEIGMVSRDMKSHEADLKAFAVGYDGVAMLVHKQNPIEQLTDQNVVDVYTGKITSWSVLGGKAEKIVLINKAEGRSTLEVFLSHFKLRNSDIRPNVIIGENLQGIKTVAANPSSIGYVSIGSVAVSQAAGVPIKMPKLNGIEASLANVQTRKFPLMRTLHLVTGPATSPQALDFVQFVSSGSVNDLVKANFFVPLAG